MWSDLKIRVASLLRRAEMEQEMAEEIQAHLERETDKLAATGLPRPQARRQAALALGGVEVVKEHTRDTRGTRWLEEAWRDVRHAVRLLGRQKRFTAALVLTMALGIGANTAVTSAIDEILWRPLTVPNADRIIGIFGFDRSTSRYGQVSLPDIIDFDRASSLQAVAGYWRRPVRATFASRTEALTSEVVTAGYFRVLAAPFVVGRPFSSEDETSSAPVAVISERLWRERFGGAATAVGQTIRLDGQNVPIVGIAPRALRGDHNLNWYPAPDVWIPVAAVGSLFGTRYDTVTNRAVPIFVGLGLLRPGVSTAAADAELNAMFAGVRPGNGANANHTLRIFPAAGAKFYPGYREDFSRNLSVFGMAATLILLLAAANVANLLVERTSRRRRELAVRAALGAGRGRLVRQLFVEGLVLAAPGFVLSLLVAFGLQRILMAFPSALGVQLEVDLGVTGRVLAYCGGVSVLIAAGVSLVPAMRSARLGVGPLLKHAVAGPGRRRSWVSESLAVVQIGLSAVLVVGALIVARGVWIGHQTSVGFDPASVVVLAVDRFSGTKTAPLPPTILDRDAWLPAGVTDVALSSSEPFTGGSGIVKIEEASATVSVDSSFVSSSFFGTLGIPIVSGRVFDSRDAAPGQSVMVNESLARRLWGAESALGRSITVGSKTLTVVGVTGNTRYRNVWEPGRPQIFRPIGPDLEEARTIFARTNQSPDTMLPAIVRAWTSFAPTVPIEEAMTGNALKLRALEPMRLMGALVGAFTLVAIGIAGVGLYSTISWMVEQRSREIAVRIAIGGQPGGIGRSVMARALALTVAGSALGLALAAGLTPRLNGLTHGMASGDPWVMTTSAIVLLAVTVVAAALPTRRAVHIDPIVILKSE